MPCTREELRVGDVVEVVPLGVHGQELGGVDLQGQVEIERGGGGAPWGAPPYRRGNRVALAGDESAPIRTISDSEAVRQIAGLLAKASVRKARAEAEANGASAPLRPAQPGQPVE